MHDIHTHIGQFNQFYYDYHDVFSVLRNNEITETTLAYLTPKFDDSKMALEFYYAVINELKEAKEFAQKIKFNINILHWADPLLFDKGISLENIFSDFDYSGIAIHPVLHEWSKKESEKLTKIFEFSRIKKIPVFIHTGISKCDEPLQFEKWFSDFPEVEVHLAHCKAADSIIYLFSKYENLFGDTAFCPKESFEKICRAGFKSRMSFGSDFPITHYWDNIESESDTIQVSYEDLKKNYKKVLKNQHVILKNLLTI